MPTTYWAPNQASIAQVETYTFSAPAGVGSTYSAVANGKVITYSSVVGDTAATATTALTALLSQSTNLPAELQEITFANPSDGVMTATAKVPGTPFANVTVGGIAGQGLVLSTGNGLVNGIATAHTTPNSSPSDVFDVQNWLRVIGTAPGVRALPQNGDDVLVANSAVPLLWNLDRISTIQFGTYKRDQSFTGRIGLPEVNPSGYTEWRACDFKFNGPQGSVPSGGLSMVLGQGDGSGPTSERYDLQSSQYTLTTLAAGTPSDQWGIRMRGLHTANVVTALGGTTVAVAIWPGQVSGLASCTVGRGATLGVGVGVTWSTGATLTVNGGSATLNAAPAAILGSNGAQLTFTTDSLTWPVITVQGGCRLNWLVGGIITTLNMTVGCILDKSSDARLLTITNSTIDGDSCAISDPLNAITFTNATTVKQQVASGPFLFTGTRTVKVT